MLAIIPLGVLNAPPPSAAPVPTGDAVALVPGAPLLLLEINVTSVGVDKLEPVLYHAEKLVECFHQQD